MQICELVQTLAVPSNYKQMAISRIEVFNSLVQALSSRMNKPSIWIQKLFLSTEMAEISPRSRETS